MELWFSEQHAKGVKLSIKVDCQLYSGKSEFQRIDIFDSKEFGPQDSGYLFDRFIEMMGGAK